MLNLSFITQIGTSLRDFTFFELSRVKNSPTSLTCMQTSLRKKVQINKNNNNFCYISPVCPKASSGLICTKFGIRVPVADIINCAKFFVDRLRGIDFVWVEVCLFELESHG